MKLMIVELLLFGLRCCLCYRSWTDIKTYHRPDPVDATVLGVMILEEDYLKMSLSPSSDPTDIPTASPSSIPSKNPSVIPSIVPSTKVPSLEPTPETSRVPSGSPTYRASSLPSSSPTAEKYPPKNPPANPGDFYFDYHRWGPGYPETIQYNSSYSRVEYRNNTWSTRVAPLDEKWYWNEFDENGFGPWAGILEPKKPRKNRCHRFGKQSPIDVRENWAECLEHHQIRTRRGDFSIYGNEIQAQILPNKLRLLFERRPCSDFDLLECSEPDPPHADFPNNWGGYTDVIHVDFKLPSEHLLYGERFDGEMQIFHIHPTRRRTPTIVSLMRASKFGYNPVLQQIIDEFQYKFNTHASQCRATHGGRNLREYTTKTEWNITTAAHLHNNNTAHHYRRRRLQPAVFSPHHKLLVPSIHFFGYEGSLTEPPCSEFVSWFITDTPMQLSFQQLEQLKRIQFNHVDANCQKTSVHYRESNARPIQDSFGRPVWKCTPNDFVADQFPFDGY